MLRWLSFPRRKQRPAIGADLSALLGRSPVNLDTPELQRFLAQKTILVTGAGGSIGSEICRQMMKFCPGRLILLDRAENALFEIDRELRESWLGADIVPLVADIGDGMRIEQIFTTLRPQVIFHCAAHKHVPMMEANPGEAIKNNVLGTKSVADAALASRAEAFVMVSTDKAVNPTSVMGASKRVAELYVQALNEGTRDEGRGAGKNPTATPAALSPDPALSRCFENNPPIGTPQSTIGNSSSTRFVAVRFGNVLGSSGSVIPIFRKQIAAGGPVTVTHADMRRYFMTIPEASQLVMQAGAIGNGGEIFVLDMGQPVRILDLAHDMIRQAGLLAGKDIDVQITGVRPGEKLSEELSADNEPTCPTGHQKISVWQLPHASSTEANQMIQQLQNVINAPRMEVLAALVDCVPEFQPDQSAAAQGVCLIGNGPQVEDQASALRRLVKAQAA